MVPVSLDADDVRHRCRDFAGGNREGVSLDAMDEIIARQRKAYRLEQTPSRIGNFGSSVVDRLVVMGDFRNRLGSTIEHKQLVDE